MFARNKDLAHLFHCKSTLYVFPLSGVGLLSVSCLILLNRLRDSEYCMANIDRPR